LFPPINEQIDVIRKGAVEIIPEDDFVRKIEKSYKTNTPLRIKFGCDPGKPDLHIGHSVVLWKLREFQNLGHIAVLIIGDFTGMIGDPSGRNKTRTSPTIEETRRNGITHFEQATKILTAKRVEMIYNSEWLSKMKFEEVINLASKYSVSRMLERSDFDKRYKAHESIGIHEFLYPLAQAMDSVAIKSDFELGGCDQKFNLLIGREIQKEFKQDPQVILTMPLLAGVDGKEKMSKSLGNDIAFKDSPQIIYNKILSIPDELIFDYFLLTANKTTPELESIKNMLQEGDTNTKHLKRQLAKDLIEIYYNKESAEQTEKEFDQLLIQKKQPEEIPELIINQKDFSNITIVQLLVQSGLANSNSEARRLIQQGTVTYDNEKIDDITAKPAFKPEFVLNAGKRKFIKIIIN
jgi:tyrosyl-tRNA synthetase